MGYLFLTMGSTGRFPVPLQCRSLSPRAMRKVYALMPKNETHFFQALSEIVGSRNLKAKSTGVKVSCSDVFLDKDYKRYEFPDQIMSMFSSLLKELRSTESVGTGSLSHHIDGFLVDHPKYGSRIVEFDEEQHFNTFRTASLRQLTTHIELNYLGHYQEYCNDLNCFNQMLRKHRLKAVVKSVPKTIESFINLVQTNATPDNGYIEPKTGFNYVGGRIAQRSYYDTLRDVAHLSLRNQSLAPPLRMTAFEFEKETGQKFIKIPQNELRTLVERRLSTLV